MSPVSSVFLIVESVRLPIIQNISSYPFLYLALHCYSLLCTLFYSTSNYVAEVLGLLKEGLGTCGTSAKISVILSDVPHVPRPSFNRPNTGGD